MHTAYTTFSTSGAASNDPLHHRGRPPATGSPGDRRAKLRCRVVARTSPAPRPADCSRSHADCGGSRAGTTQHRTAAPGDGLESGAVRPVEVVLGRTLGASNRGDTPLGHRVGRTYRTNCFSTLDPHLR